jgi:hypothetical protein
MMNVKLLTASALSVQSGASLVSHNCFINFLQLSNVKPTQVCSAQAGRQVNSTALAAPQWNCEPQICLRKGRQITRTKAYRQ